MRTTIDLDEDILLATKELARQRGIPMSKIISELLRQALTRPVTTETRSGIPLFPRQPNAGVVTLEIVNQLRDETA
ncbi:MAG TPA: CopG family transcriptional regulator [Anaerolineae bacterium]|nr:CopG family transcriptional regulator [Anaerolineae bacterium]HMR65777.1 CopG family transcriptional regulator [Anaerolineae bacterium]